MRTCFERTFLQSQQNGKPIPGTIEVIVLVWDVIEGWSLSRSFRSWVDVWIFTIYHLFLTLMLTLVTKMSIHIQTKQCLALCFWWYACDLLENYNTHQFLNHLTNKVTSFSQKYYVYINPTIKIQVKQTVKHIQLIYSLVQ